MPDSQQYLLNLYLINIVEEVTDFLNLKLSKIKGLISYIVIDAETC